MPVVINGTTGVSGVAGSASTPALIGTDADSGYYINSANEPNASVNGTATWSAASSFGFKNRFINGGMSIDQRNAGASVSTSSGIDAYSVDRWQLIYSQTSKFTAQRNSGSVTPPAGFTNYIGAVSASAYSVGSTDYFGIRQNIEGYNIADLNWGTASAKSVTISFWVRSSLTGTFGGAIQNNAATNFYAFSYTISSANTWEYKTITVPGPTSGTWLTDSSAGLRLTFSIGVGSTYSISAGSWGTTPALSVTGATSVVGTNGATFYMTGVQFEVGSTATSFDFRSYGTELALCQRYCQVFGSGTHSSITGTSSASNIYSVPLVVTMRTAPSFSGNLGVTQYYFNSAGGAQLNQAVAYASLSFSVAGASGIRFVTPAAGQAGLSGWVDFASGQLNISAEL